jgi:RNA polymerase sigma-70 factor (ECF subfamily)
MLKNRNQTAETLDTDFEEVFERYYPRVSRFFSRRGFSADESQDLAQKTFLKVYRGWERHRRGPHGIDSRAEPWDRYRREPPPPERETSWIFTIALNVYRNEIRRSNARKRDASVKPLEPLRETGWEPTAPDGGPESDTLGKQRVQLLAKALDELPPGMRRCFELRFAHGLKYKDIAEVLKISIQSVRSQLHQARKRLEGLLSGQ